MLTTTRSQHIESGVKLPAPKTESLPLGIKSVFLTALCLIAVSSRSAVDECSTDANDLFH